MTVTIQGPLFSTRPLTKRLNKDDADVVEVLHTDGGTFGFKDACGTIDFFANGGSSQPGCKQIDLANPLRSLDDPGKFKKVSKVLHSCQAAFVLILHT